MEGVGARLGRSSTRYGPTTVFTGPVRKWKKKWVPVSASTAANHSSQSNGNNGSHLLLYKWSPISQTNNDNGDKGKDDTAAAAASEEPTTRKKFKYVPIAVLEDQKREDAEDLEEEEDEAKPSETDPSMETTSKTDGTDGKPDMNDVPMEEAQAPEKEQSVPQDLNETSLDLSLGLKGHDGDRDSDNKPESESKVGL